jgi:photosystem II stability/assembly factor-like uncharacterized protein
MIAVGYRLSDPTHYGIILKTNDGGITWAEIPCGHNKYLNSVFFANSTTGYIAGSDTANHGIMLKTTDGGASWTNLSIPANNGLQSVFFTDINTGYAAGADGIILKTMNGGINWTEQPSGTTNVLTSIYFPDALNGNLGYVAGFNGTILKTTDAGTSWSVLPVGSCNYFFSIYFTGANTGYVAGSNGTIMKTTTGGSSFVNEIGTDTRIFNLYPNPASERITVEKKGTPVKEGVISIIDLNGRLVKQTGYDHQNLEVMDVSALSPGVYLVKIQTDAELEVKKLVIK